MGVEANGDIMYETAPGLAAGAEAPRVGARRASLLVVDDDESLGRALGRMLGAWYDVTLAGTAGEAIALIERSGAFDLILCDVSMPDVGGVEFFERLGGAHAEVAERIVFMTGGSLELSVAESLREHAHRTICKPFTRDVLLAVIEAHLRAFDRG